MKKLFLLFLVLFAFNFAKADDSKIHPYLQGVMNSTSDNQQINIYIWFDDYLTLEDFNDIPYNMPKNERRKIVINRLKEFSESYQRGVRDYVNVQKSRGASGDYEVLWMSNMMVLKANSEVISDLADFDNVRMICFDAEYPEEEVYDDISRAPFTSAVVDNASSAPQIGCVLINADDCWALGNKGEGVVVGNSDTGFQWRHQDVVRHIFQNLGEDANNNGKTIIVNSGLTSTFDPGDQNGVDDDGNGKIDDFIGWDWGTNSGNITSSGHGTSTLGQVNGDGTNGTQTGVAPDATSILMRPSGGLTVTNQLLAFQYAVEMGADVITSSLSYKWYFNPKPDYSAMRIVTEMSLVAGVIHSNSTSNNGNSVGVPLNISTSGCDPAPWVHPDQTLVGGIGGVIGVGNVTASTDIISSSSPHGPFTWGNWSLWGTYSYPIHSTHKDYPYSRVAPVEPDSMGLIKPDVSAPGAGTTSISTGGGYSSFGGTSSATPHTAGVMALMLSINPEMLPQDVAKVIQLTAVEKGDPGKDNRYGAGRIDALAATTSPKFTLEGINGGSNMLINGTLQASDTARELVGLKISTNINPEVGSLKMIKFGISTSATGSDINSYDLYFDADNSGAVNNGDKLIQSVPFAGGPVTFDKLKFKFLDTERQVILCANTTGSASSTAISVGLTDTNQVTAYYTTTPFSTNFPFGTVTSTGNNGIEQLSYELSQNYPNPFNPVTLINYTVANDGPVKIRIYDMLGKEVSTLINGFKKAGNYRVEFDANDFGGLSSGVYYYKMEAGEFNNIRKMILLK